MEAVAQLSSSIFRTVRRRAASRHPESSVRIFAKRLVPSPSRGAKRRFASSLALDPGSRDVPAARAVRDDDREVAVARMKRSEIRGLLRPDPHCASLHAGYDDAAVRDDGVDGPFSNGIACQNVVVGRRHRKKRSRP
jgi:hypothetical protein